MKLKEHLGPEQEKKLSEINFIIFNNDLEEAKEFLELRNINTWGFLNYSNSYGKKYTYSNLFDKKFSDNNTEITKREFDTTLEGLKETKVKLEELYKKYKILDLGNKEIKQILLEKIEFDKNYLEMLLNSVFLEAEKLGLELDENIKKEKEKKVWEIQKKLYGPSISENMEEQEEVISNLEKLYENNFSKLNKQEQEYFEFFLEKKGGNISKKEKNKSKENKETKEEEKIHEKKIFVNNFKNVLEKYLIIQEKLNPSKKGLIKMTDYKVVINEDTMVSVNFKKKNIYLPKNRKYTIKDLGLIDHEIVTHIYRGKNTLNNLGGLMVGYGIEEAEEGNAMSSQYFAEGKKSLEKSAEEPLIHFITNFIGENYNFEDTKKLIFLYLKMKENGKIDDKEEEIKEKAHNRAVRVKGFYSFSGLGANMKDLAYYRGLKKAGKKILEAINGDKEKKEEILDWLKQNYNIGKIGFDDLELFKQIVPEYKDEKLPLFLGKLLLSKLKGEKIYFSETPENGKFSGAKLWGEKDFRFEYENISKEIKKMIIEILRILKN